MGKLNILITGPEGFLARELRDYFKGKHNIIGCGRFDVRDDRKVYSVLNKHKVDVVIHTATRGGKASRHGEDCFEDLVDNLSMFNSLIKHKDMYKLLFCFCSGAAFNKKEEVCNLSEEEIFNRKPYDFYGLSKNLIAREVHKHSKVFNFRLFGCFGKHEESSRFFSSLWNSVKCDRLVRSEEIHEKREMDFFWAQDVGRVIEFYMDNYKEQSLPQDLNLVYSRKFTLCKLANMFAAVMAPYTSFSEPEKCGLSYTGNGNKLKSIGVELRGMVSGFINSYIGEENEFI